MSNLSKVTQPVAKPDSHLSALIPPLKHTCVFRYLHDPHVESG